MESLNPRIQALYDKIRNSPEGEVKPPPMRLVRNGFFTYQETLVDMDKLPPPPKPWSLRDLIDPRRWFGSRQAS